MPSMRRHTLALFGHLAAALPAAAAAGFVRVPRLGPTLVAFVALVAAPALRAQPGAALRATFDPGGRCAVDDYQRFWYQSGTPFCRVRRLVLTRPRGALVVDASGSSGAISVRGAVAGPNDKGRDSVHAEAVVVTWAGTEAEAERLAGLVRVDTAGGVLRATGFPERTEGPDRRYWSVSYRVVVPRRTDLDLRAYNSGIDVAEVIGRLRLDTHNGGVTLKGVGGDVVAHTNNGGVRATLTGRAWDAGGLPDAGLELTANNGGAVLRIPDGYAAHVRLGVNNGAITTDFPVTVRGRVNPRELDLALGGGGALLRVFSNNGGARLARAE